MSSLRCLPLLYRVLWRIAVLVALFFAVSFGALVFSRPASTHAALTYCSEYPTNYTLTSYNQAVSGTHNGAPPADWGVKTGSYNWGSGSVEACNNSGQGVALGDEITGVFSSGSLITTFDSNGNLGTTAGGTPGDAFQCIELIERYAYLRWHDAPTTWIGNAGDTWNAGQHPHHFQQYANDGTSSVPPQAGDILVWQDGGAGHIAIITSSNPSTQQVTTLEQNFHYYVSQPGPGGWYGDAPSRTIHYTVSNGHYTLDSQYTVNGSVLQNMETPTGWFHDPTTGVSNPVYSNHAEYSIGSDHHLYNYLYQPGTNWTRQDVSGTTATLQGSVASYDINSCHFAFAIDTSGHLHEYYRCSLTGSWTQSDLSNALGVTFTGSPQGYAFIDPSTNAVHHSLNLIGTDQHFYNVFYTPASNWQATDVSSVATFTGTPSGYAVITSSYYELVYIVASNGSLYEFVHTGSAWALQNTFSSLASGVTAIDSSSAYSYVDSSGNTDHSVFVLGSDHHLYNLVYRPATNWQTYDVSGSAITYNYSPSGHFSYQSNGLHFVYAVSSSGSLEEYYSTDGTNSWSHVSLSASGLNGSPESYSYLASANATSTTHIIFFPETDGHLHEEAYTTAWSAVDLGLPATGVSVQSNADGYGF